MSRKEKHQSWKKRKFKPDNVNDELIEKLADSIASKRHVSESKFKSFSIVVGNWAQVFILIAIMYGYINTVLPVFEKELIKEELSRLQVEKIKWKDEVDVYNHDIELLAKEKESLSKSIAQHETALKTVKQKLYEHQKNQITGNDEIPKSYLALINHSIGRGEFSEDENKSSDANSLSEMFRGIFDKKAASHISERLKQDYIQPIDLANKILAELRGSIKLYKNKYSREVAQRILGEYKQGLKKKKTLLTCPRVNYKAWEDSFVGALKYTKQLEKECVKQFFNKRILDEKWSSEDVADLKDSDFWRKQTNIYKHSCASWRDIGVKWFFRDKWSEAKEPCNKRLYNVGSIVLGETDNLELTSYVDMSPPSITEVKDHLNVRLQEWLKQ